MRIRRLGTVFSLSLASVAGLVAVGSPVRAASCTIAHTLRSGARSEEVRCLETTLIELGYSLVGPDTSFGTSTKNAVRAFQRTNGLTADGVIGPRTGGAMGIWAPVAAPAAAPGVPARIIETRLIGKSLQGRDINAYRMGTPGGRVVMIVGVIHGDEDKGNLVTELLKTLPTPANIDLWIIDSINPDGQAAGTRENANRVDLNRNFEVGWSYIPIGDHHQYSGEAAADQPETQAMEAFVTSVKPVIAIWYHQDANKVTVGGARPSIPKAYAQLVGLGTGDVPCTQRCTGTAGKFVNTKVNGATSFLVELPGSARVTSDMVKRHANAVLAVITL